MKKILLFLLLGLLPQLIHAQTAKAIWCSGNTTLYFTYDTNTYAVGGTYDGQTITNVYSINDTGKYYSYTIPWRDHRKSVTNIVIEPNFKNYTPTTLAFWFSYSTTLTTITGINHVNTSNVTSLNTTFGHSSSLASPLDLSSWDVSMVTNMSHMFVNCIKLPSLNVSNWDTSKVTTFSNMFSGCSGLTSLDVSSWDTSSVTDLDYMFTGCSELTFLDVSNWDTGKVTSMLSTFQGCNKLSTLDVSEWDVSNVTNMNFTFQYCWNLTALDVSNWNTENLRGLSHTFNECRSLTNFTFGKNFTKPTGSTSGQRTFLGCDNLRYIDFYDSDATDCITADDWSSSSSMLYGLASTTVIYLPHGSQQVTSRQNVVYSYNGDKTDLRCPQYYSLDKNSSGEYVDIEFPRNFITHKAIYQRKMTNNYGSVILPYDFTTNDKVQAYTLDEEHTETMYFRDTQTVPAHTPFAFNVKQKGSGNVVDFTMADSSNNFGITVKATHTTHPDEKGWDGVAGAPYSSNTNLTGWTAKGYYVNQTIEKTDPLYSDLHYIAGEKFYKAAGETLKFPPHRVTFHGTWTKGNTSSGAKSFVFAASSDEVVTAIEEAETRQTLRDAEAIYDLAGRRQHEAQKGVNIVRMKDGSVRKMFVK